MPKLSVIGLDGVDWDVLERAFEKGLMPNTQEVVEGGYSADLETTYPPVTGPAWTSIMTGVNPGRHGVFDFIDHTEGGRPYDSRDIQADTIYGELSRRGEVCVVNLPLSYPPGFDGDFVGSFLAPDDDFIRPRSLGERFDFDDYKKSLDASEKAFSLVKSSRKAASDKKRLVEGLMDDQDLFFLLFSATDWVMHDHYHEMKEGRNEDAFDVFRIVDEAIGIARERSDNLILLSDHGFQSFEKVFHVNQWLKDNGYLETGGSMDDLFNDSPVVSTALDALSRFELTRRLSLNAFIAVKDFLPIPENHRIGVETGLSEGIDMEESRAFTPSSGIRGIYINDDRFSGVVEDRGEVVEEILAELPDTVDAYRREEIFDGPETDNAPDIVFEETDERVMKSLYGAQHSSRRTNHHGRVGFLAAEGEDFGSGGRDRRSIYDVAPTIAGLFGIEFEADGEPLPFIQGRIDLGDRDLPDDF
ncbi:MAG: alkaline phosphatase family protein [Candidatus Nanohaloarchaea archaeon]